jgi:menaquinone-dependent protoporphyrinogen oxidase
MNILVIYGTTEGQTRKVAQFLADRFAAKLHDVRLFNSDDLPDGVTPEDYDGVLMAARVHTGAYPPAIRRFIENHRDALTTRPTGFVSVSMSASRDGPRDRAAVVKYVERLFGQTGWHTNLVHHAAGARFYSRLGPFGRWVLRHIDSRPGRPIDTSRDREWTDWQALGSFGDAFLEAVRAAGSVAIAKAA